jgi:hypothetical protein
MSTTSKRSAMTRRPTSPPPAEPRRSPVGNASPDEELRRRAYDIYLERGDQPGSALDDWLQAERELGRTS